MNVIGNQVVTQDKYSGQNRNFIDCRFLCLRISAKLAISQVNMRCPNRARNGDENVTNRLQV